MDSFLEFRSPYDGPPIPKRNVYFFLNNAILGLAGKVLKHSGLSQTKNISEAKIIWGRQLDDKDWKNVHVHQKINHFAHIWKIGRKDELHWRMRELEAESRSKIPFYPKSFLLPNEINEFKADFSEDKLYIYKPAAASGGKGIKIFKNNIPTTRGIVQEYITNPMLITKRKFDIRLFILITSIDPIIIYRYQNGIVRFATEEYTDNTDVICAHLTNVALNRDNPGYIMKKEENVRNSKWSLRFFIDYLDSHGIDSKELFRKIDDACIKILVVGLSVVQRDHLEIVGKNNVSFELLGVDVLIGNELNPYILEINISPSMEASGPRLDSVIKTKLLADTLNLVGIRDTIDDDIKNEKELKTSLGDYKLIYP